MKYNAVYAQSGGVTPVINASAYGVWKGASGSAVIGNLYAGLNGINGVLDEDLIDLGQEDAHTLELLRTTPGGAFGSARRKLKDLAGDKKSFLRILEVLDAHNIRYFFYNGGNDSMDTVAKLSAFASSEGYDLVVVGIPKTIDNDLPITDNCPGFGSVAKYNAISMMEAGLDTESMCKDSTRVFVLETMGRHAGWIAAATGLASARTNLPPHLILLPEVPFDAQNFLAKVEQQVSSSGYCCVTVSEGTKDLQDRFLVEGASRDDFGHVQLGGAGQYIQNLVNSELKLKTHGAVLDYCQRSSRHIASAVDSEQAEACGYQAVKLAEQGAHGQMVIIERTSDAPYQWTLGHIDAAKVANQEKKIPRSYISEDGYHITDAFYKYAQPLIQGEGYPSYNEGLPNYARLKKNCLPKKLQSF